MHLKKIAVLLVLVLLSASVALGQEVTANIAGTVTDPTGAVISGASITIVNTDTNQLRALTTDATGGYSAPLLPIGHYKVTAAAPGFTTLTSTGITLNVNDKRQVNFVLKVGGEANEVNVEANPLQVETLTSTAAGLVSGTQIRELSLNNRNYQQLLTLVPGVASTASDQMYVGGFNPTGAANTVQFSINGGRTSQNNWMIDGADNVDRGANLTLSSFPSVDAIAEFKVLRSNYDAEFGRNGAGQINVVTRTGTSTFHGGAYEFVRNDYFNANSYFNKYNRAVPLPRPRVRYNNFGWTLGGPVYIPGVYNTKKDKTFFFFSQEFRHYNVAANPTATVPTLDERGGSGAALFTSPVCTQWSSNFAGATCTQTGTSIPASAWSPLAAAYVKDIVSKIPAPNPTTGQDQHTLRSSWTNIFRFREELFKIDHNFGQRLTVSGKILRDDIPTEEPGGIYSAAVIPGMATTSTNSPGHNYGVRGTATLSPTLLLEAGWAYNYSAIVSRVLGFTKLENSPTVAGLLGGLPFKTVHDRIPNIAFQNGSSFAGNGPYNDFNFNHQFFGNVSKIWNTHTFKFGATYNRYRKTEDNTSGTEGTFNFNNAGLPAGGATNYMQSWANFLLGHATGTPNAFSQSAVNITPDIRQNSFEFFGQDTWRIKPNVTLTYGVRWSIFRQPFDEQNQISNFDPKAYDPAKAPCINADGTLDITSIVNGKPVSACNANYDPLNGFYISGKNSPWGRKVSNEDMNNFAPRVGIAWDPWGDGKTSVRAGWGMFYDTILVGSLEFDVLFNPYLVNSVAITNTSLDNPTGGTSGALSAARSAKRVYGRVPDPWQNPYSEQYSLDVQRELGRGFMLDVGYYGSQGHHLIGVIDYNQPVPFDYVTKLACPAGVTTNCVPTGSFITSGTTGLLNRIRPYLGYTGLDMMETMFNQNYNSLQVQLQKKFAGDGLVNIAYTWSHSLTDNQTDRSSAPQNSRDIRADYGPTPQDRRHVFTANFVYPLPWFKAQKGVVGHVLGGWQFSGIASYWTGVPLTVTGFLPGTASIDPAGLGCLGPSPCGIRPDMIANPMMGAPLTQAKWFNTSAFTNTPAGQYHVGTERRGTVYGPGIQRWDLSVFKNFKITERVSTQLRLESFNAFNHVNFDGVNTTLSSTGSSGFGAITSTRDPRNVQLGMKVNF